jgi:hypothetical protein
VLGTPGKKIISSNSGICRFYTELLRNRDL